MGMGDVKDNMKVALVGGHFSPALSILERLQKKGDEVVVLGRKKTFEGQEDISLEYRICEEKKIPFYEIRASRLQRRFTRHTIPSFLKFAIGVNDAYQALKKTKPDVVLSFGGYLSIPIAISAKMLRIPLVIHEQTQHAGLANKIVAKVAEKVLITFSSSERFFPKDKIVVTGNPLRKEIFEIKKIQKVTPDKKILYVTGGSSGSHFINELIGSTIGDLVKEFTVIHQIGDGRAFHDFDTLEKVRNSLPEKLRADYILKKFVYPDEIGWVLAHADLVVARSGVNTVLELIALKKRALLIPLPHGQIGEQLVNAQLIKKMGLGEYVEQNRVERQKFLDLIHTLMKKNNHSSEEQKNSIVLDADVRIVKILDSIYEKKKAKAAE